MKKSYIYLLISLFVLSVSCSKFIDTKPISFTTVDNFYQTEDDIEIALRGCYSRMINSYSVNSRAGLFYIGNIGTDELIGNPYSTPDAATNMDQFLLGRVVKTNRMMTDWWANMYQSIFSINQLLSGLDNIKMDEEHKVQIEGQARFLRGWHYMYLGMVYGGVPVYISVPQSRSQARNTLKEVMEQSIDDLTFAYEKLNDEKTPGYAIKWTAAGYLAKLYCFLASCKKFNVGQDLSFPLNSFDWVNIDGFYTQARNLADEIISSGKYSLVNDYRLLFLEKSVSSQDQENLFTFLPSEVQQVGFAPNYYLYPVGFYGKGWGTCRPTQEVYDRFDQTNDVRGGWVVGGLATESETEKIDNTKYYKPLPLHLSGGVAYDGDYSVTKLRLASSSASDAYFGHFPLLRLADIYLLFAEATAHLEGDEAGREALKPIRKRALKSGDVSTLQAAYRRSDFIQELLDERSRELCFEQQRKFDLVRFGRYVSTIKSLSTTRGVWNSLSARLLIDNISAKHIWLPISEEDEISNPNLLPNNPGY